MLKDIAASIAVAIIAASTLPIATLAADLVTGPALEAPARASPLYSEMDMVSRREALSEYISLLMVRATFDVIDRADIEGLVESQLGVWGGRAPSAEAKVDLDRQLLAEGSYYLVSLSYTVKVGGAAFPDDKSEMVYTNDTIVALDTLQRTLADAIANGEDSVPIFLSAEKIRALTEGSAEISPDASVFSEHAAILDRIVEAAARGTQT